MTFAMPEPGQILEYVAQTLDIIKRAQEGDSVAIDHCLNQFKEMVIASVTLSEDPEVLSIVRRFAEEEIKQEQEGS